MKKFICFLLLLICIDRLDAQSLTVREVYDLHVGDELGILKSGSGPAEYRFMKVIDRKEISLDSLKLSYFVRTMEWTQQGKKYGEDDTLTVFLGNLDSPFFKNYIEHYSVFTKYADSQKKYWQYTIEYWDSSYTDACGHLINRRFYSHNSEIEYMERDTLVYKGLGALYRRYSFAGLFEESRYYEELKYYIKDGVLCGNKKTFPLSLTQAGNVTEVLIYPNPTSGRIFISAMPEFSYSLVDLQGLELMHGLGMGEYPINVEHLPPGLYFIFIDSGNGFTTHKVLLE